MKFWRKLLKPERKTLKYIDNLPCVYIVACWAHYGVAAYPFSGEWTEDELGRPVPLVWKWEDHNGMREEYVLTDVYHVTTGLIRDWTFHESAALKLAEAYEKEI